MSRVKFGFLMLSFLLVIALFGMIFYTERYSSKYRKRLIMPITIGIVAIIFYSAFLMSSDYFGALVLDELYFICTDWMALTMLAFTIEYTNTFLFNRKTGRIVQITLLAGVFVDTASLLINTYTHHSFDISWEVGNSGQYYWSLSMTPLHYVHLGYCYVLVMYAFVLLIASARRMPELYKNKYRGIFLAYLLVTIVNFVCYSLDLTIDVSILFYGILAGFICYYSSYGFPVQVLNQSLRDVMKSFSEGIVYYDSDEACIFINESALSMFAEDDDEYTYSSVKQYHDDIVLDKMSNHKNALWTDSFKVKGKTHHYQIEAQKVYSKGDYVGYFVRFRDITREVNSIERERYLATHDSLTGIYNREGFFEAADRLLIEDPETERLMLYSNINDFKLLNGMFGTAVGDAVLKKQADIMNKYCDGDTLFGRITDDKFAMLIRVSDFIQEDFIAGIEELRKLAESNVYQLHIYIGVYDPQGQREPAHIMCDKAKMAINAISGDYRKVFAFYDDQLMEQLLLEKDIVNRFEDALYKGQFMMYLQAQVDAQGQMLGAEALARWQHPVHGLLPPRAFIETLEKTGYIHYLDVFMWEQAVKQLRIWKDKGRDDIYISVNVSPRDFYYIDIYQAFVGLVRKYNVEPSKLKIEVTESIFALDYNKIVNLFTKLQEYGFELVIDDFGSGYASLNVLKDMKANTLKMDINFMKHANNEERSEKVLSSIIEMAKALDMAIITENVETKERVQALYEIGCNLFQGHYFSRPITVEEFEKKYHIE